MTLLIDQVLVVRHLFIRRRVWLLVKLALVTDGLLKRPNPFCLLLIILNNGEAIHYFNNRMLAALLKQRVVLVNLSFVPCIQSEEDAKGEGINCASDEEVQSYFYLKISEGSG